MLRRGQAVEARFTLSQWRRTNSGGVCTRNANQITNKGGLKTIAIPDVVRAEHYFFKGSQQKRAIVSFRSIFMNRKIP